MAHHDAFGIGGQYQQVLARLRLIGPTRVIKGLEILSHLDHHPFTLALGDMPPGRLIKAGNRLIEAHQPDVPSQASPQPVGVFIGRQIQLRIQGKSAPHARRAVGGAAHNDLAKEGGEVPLAVLAPMGAEDVIVAFKTLPVGFGGGAMIKIALEHAPQEFAARRLEELLNLAMVKLLGGGVVQGGHHVGEFLEGAGKYCPFVESGVCLGHEDVSFVYVEVDLTYTYYGGVSLATPISYNRLKTILFYVVIKEPHP